MASGRQHGAARLVFPHQLFPEQLQAPPGTLFVVVEDDLFFRQYTFHAQKLVLHRASMQVFADQLQEAGHVVEYVATNTDQPSMVAVAEVLRRHQVASISCFDVVDDWLSQRVNALVAELGVPFTAEHVLESPNFLTTRAEFTHYFHIAGKRQHDFYLWQRKRLGILMDGDQPVGGKWSFDEDNRKKLPKGHVPPPVSWPKRSQAVTEAISYVTEHFPQALGIDQVDNFRYPTTSSEAMECFEEFLAQRFCDFGPYEDAISTQHAEIYHSLLTPALNIGLINPADVVHRALNYADNHAVPLASLEGFIRQIIGWREYMRASYHLWGRAMRSRNRLNHSRNLAAGWWDGTVGLAPVDHVINRLLATGYCHHIERLMVLGNAMCLLRITPDEVYEWFMALFIDAYDWVMVPNVYAMSQFACGDFITTKPYVSGSNYLKKMSDFGPGEWRDAWDGLYWAFVDHHRDVFAANYRSKMMVTMWDKMDGAKQASHLSNAAPWLASQQ